MWTWTNKHYTLITQTIISHRKGKGEVQTYWGEIALSIFLPASINLFRIFCIQIVIRVNWILFLMLAILKPMDSFGMWWKSNEILFSSSNHNVIIVLCELLMPCQLFAHKCSNCQEITKISKWSGFPRTLCHW